MPDVAPVISARCMPGSVAPIAPTLLSTAPRSCRRTCRILQMLAEALAARQEDIGRAIAQRVVAEIPEYARAPEDVLEDLVQGATATAGLLARAFDGRLGRAELAVIREL